MTRQEATLALAALWIGAGAGYVLGRRGPPEDATSSAVVSHDLEASVADLRRIVERWDADRAAELRRAASPPVVSPVESASPEGTARAAAGAAAAASVEDLARTVDLATGRAPSEWLLKDRKEVRSALGDPDLITTENAEETWVYGRPRGNLRLRFTQDRLVTVTRDDEASSGADPFLEAIRR